MKTAHFPVILLMVAVPLWPQQFVISTPVGTATAGYSGDGGLATKALLNGPKGVAVDHAGNLYIADASNNRVRKVSTAGIITTVAGGGTAGLGDGGLATSAQLNGPTAVALDNSGNLFIADTGNNRVRQVSSAGTITTFAGTGTAGYSGDGGPALSAQLQNPEGLALDPAGDLFIADTANYRIRKVAVNGTITTVAGNGVSSIPVINGHVQATSVSLSAPFGVALDTAGDLYIADALSSQILKVATDGTISTVADGVALELFTPTGVALDASGNIYASDTSERLSSSGPRSGPRVAAVSSSGQITTVAGNGTVGDSGDGGPAANAQLNNPHGLAFDGSGDLYVADTGNNAIRLLTTTGGPLTITTASPLAQGAIGLLYSQNLTASGGTPPYTWTVASGALPAGLTLSTTGTLAGTPTGAGTATFTVQVADSASATATKQLSLTTQGSALSITTTSPLPSGFVGGSYSQTLVATGGVPPYTWSISSGSLPSGLALSSSGTITGTPLSAAASTVTVQAKDSSGLTATQSLALTVVSAGALTSIGSFAQFPTGGGWNTSITLVNTGTSAVAVRLVIRTEDGSALAVPLTVTQQGTVQTLTASTLDAVVNPNATLHVVSASQSAAAVGGWVNLLTSGAINGFAIFTYTGTNPASEGTVPLQLQTSNTVDLPYDNTGGYVTGVALANLAATAVTVNATIFDANGTQLGVQSVPLPANGHTSFLVNSQFSVTAGQQGLIQFQSSSSLAGLGLRANPSLILTSVPIIIP